MTDGRLPFTEGVGRRSLAALLMLAMAFALSPLAAQAEDRLNMTVLEGANNVAAALSWSKLTYTTANDAIIGRDDLSPDNLSSGMVQGLLAAPLLLTGSSALNADVKAELTRLGVRTVHILGGTGAISSSVESALKAEGYSVRRYSGKSRIETALAVAGQFGGSAATGFLSRAFGSGADETGTWADALGGGAWSAQTGWPVLLSQSDTLTPATRTYIQGSRLRKIIILGGTSAISAAAEAQVQALGVTTERVSGANRFATATAIAVKRGFSTAAAATTIVLADGQNTNAWAAGFAAAGYAASGKPIVLSNAGALPTETDSWFAGGTSSKNLIVAPYVVEAASTAAANKLSLLKKAAVTLDATSFATNSAITGKVAPVTDVTSTSVSGACVTAGAVTLNSSTGAFSIEMAPTATAGSCELTFTTTYSNSSTQSDKLTVTLTGPGPTSTVTDAPELTNVVVANTTDAHVLLRYTFDEAVTIVTPGSSTDFKLSGFAAIASAVFSPNAPSGSAVRADPNDNTSVLVSFKKLQYQRSTTATVAAGAVKDFQEVSNPRGSRGLQALTYGSGNTTRPELTNVSLEKFDKGAPGVANWVVRATFTFNRSVDMFDKTMYKLVKKDATTIAADSLVSGNGTATHVMEFVAGVTDEPSADLLLSNARRGVADTDQVSGGTLTKWAVEDSEDRSNVPRAILLNGGALDSGKPYLTSVALSPSTSKATFVFSELPTTTLTAAKFFVYNHDGQVVVGSGTVTSDTPTKSLTVTFTSSGLFQIDGQTAGGGYVTGAFAGPPAAMEIDVLGASNGAHTFASGTTMAPDLTKVIRAASVQDPFGGPTPDEYNVTFRFNKNVTATGGVAKLWAIDNAGAAVALSGGATCAVEVILTDLVCKVVKGAPSAQFTAVHNAKLFGVEAGAVKTATMATVYENYETSKVPTAS